MGYRWLNNCQVTEKPDGLKKVTLPVPDAFLTGPRSVPDEKQTSNDHSWEENDELESLH